MGIPLNAIRQNTHLSSLTRFPPFVTLEPGIDGLVHISKLGSGRRINHPREVVQEGEALEVKVEGLDLEKRRLSLATPAKVEEGQAAQGAGADGREALRQFQQQQKGGKAMGTLGDLLQKKLGKKR